MRRAQDTHPHNVVHDACKHVGCKGAKGQPSPVAGQLVVVL